jgi:hypothetical protein
MVLVRNSQFTIKVVGAAVLLNAGIKVDSDSVSVTGSKGQLVDRAAERLVDLKHNSCRQGASVLDGQVLGDGHSRHSLFPNIFEIELRRDDTTALSSHLALLNVVKA